MRPNSQNARIIKVLSDGRWHTAANVERKSGAKRLNSRISELRSRGYEIERCATGSSGRLGNKYRLLNPPPKAEVVGLVEAITSDKALPRDDVPRNMDHRYRIYRMAYEELLELVATATTPGDVGEALVTLGREGAFAQSCVGVLDTHGTDQEKGEWILNPFDAMPL